MEERDTEAEASSRTPAQHEKSTAAKGAAATKEASTSDAALGEPPAPGVGKDIQGPELATERAPEDPVTSEAAKGEDTPDPSAPEEGSEEADAAGVFVNGPPAKPDTQSGDSMTAMMAMNELEHRNFIKASWTPMNPSLNWFWRKITSSMFRDLSIDNERVMQLKETDEAGTVVYVLRSKSYLNYLIYNVLFLNNGLSLSRFAQGLYWLPWRTFGGQVRVWASWLGRLFGYGGKGADEVFRGLVRHDETTMIFLKRPVTLSTYFRRGMYWLQNRIATLLRRPLVAGGRQVDLVEELVKLQRQQDKPIFLCPQVLVWDPIPPSTRKTFWDVVFGEREFPGVVRELYQFFRNRSKSQVRGGAPINLKTVLEAAPKKLTDADIARKLRWQMQDHFAKETRVVTGPKLRPASDVKDRVLGSNWVKGEIRDEAETRGVPEEVVHKRARKILERMAANFSLPMAQRMDWILNKFWSRMYQRRDYDEPGLMGMEVDKEGMMRVREAAKTAPLLLLPSHKSHVDYLILSQVCLHYGMVPPHIAAGDNLVMPVIGWLFRRSGAFFIRRSFGDDSLYKSIFVEYLHRLLREGYNIEFFIEGGRSRTGKLRVPKLGMLGMVVDGILDKRLRDFHLAPISITYDRIVEGESYTRELLGEKKPKESLRGLLQSWNLLKVNFGRIYIQFAAPVSARAWIENHIKEEQEQNPAYDPHNCKEDRRHLVRTMAFLVVHQINEATVVMPSALVAALLMTHFQRGISHRLLVEKVEWLRDEVHARGGKVAEFENTGLVIERTVSFLGKLIKQPPRLVEAVYRPRDQRRLELSYYRNQIAHLFLAEGVVVCALLSFRQRRADDSGVEDKRLFESVRFLSVVLKLDFIFNPIHEIEVNYQKTIDKMIGRGLLGRADGRIKVATGPQPMLPFLRALFRPFIDSYWAASMSFFTMLDGVPADEKKLIEKMQQIAETLYHEGHLLYSDTVSMEPLKNALSLFQDMDVIERLDADAASRRAGFKVRRGSRSKYVVLSERYGDPETLCALVQKIGLYSSCSRSGAMATRMQDLLSPVMPPPEPLVSRQLAPVVDEPAVGAEGDGNADALESDATSTGEVESASDDVVAPEKEQAVANADETPEGAKVETSLPGTAGVEAEKPVDTSEMKSPKGEPDEG